MQQVQYDDGDDDAYCLPWYSAASGHILRWRWDRNPLDDPLPSHGVIHLTGKVCPSCRDDGCQNVTSQSERKSSHRNAGVYRIHIIRLYTRSLAMEARLQLSFRKSNWCNDARMQHMFMLIPRMCFKQLLGLVMAIPTTSKEQTCNINCYKQQLFVRGWGFSWTRGHYQWIIHVYHHWLGMIEWITDMSVRRTRPSGSFFIADALPLSSHNALLYLFSAIAKELVVYSIRLIMLVYDRHEIPCKS